MRRAARGVKGTLCLGLQGTAHSNTEAEGNEDLLGPGSLTSTAPATKHEDACRTQHRHHLSESQVDCVF